mgnify:CR=1 FL=1
MCSDPYKCLTPSVCEQAVFFCITIIIQRNTVKNSANAAQFATIEELGRDVVLVSSHIGARPLCYPYQGKFYSLSGKSGTIRDTRGKDNKFDSRAIMVLTADGKKLGYIPEKDNIIFSRLMDAGKLLSATITEIKERSGNFRQISIGIYLVDF